MKKALCILLVLLMVGCTVRAEQTEGAPQSPIEDVVLDTTKPVAESEEPLQGIWSGGTDLIDGTNQRRASGGGESEFGWV